MYRVMRKTRTRRGPKAGKLRAELLQEFEQHQDADEFMRSVPDSFIAYSPEAIDQINEDRKVA